MSDYEKEKENQIYKGHLNFNEYLKYLLEVEDMNSFEKRHLLYLTYGYFVEDIKDTVHMKLSKNTAPSLSILGSTGAGKSATLRNILRGIAAQEMVKSVDTYIFEPKGVELSDYTSLGLKRVRRYSVTKDEMMLSLYELNTVITGRIALCEKYNVMSIEKYNRAVREGTRDFKGTQALPIIFVVFDEYPCIEDMMKKDEYNVFMRNMENILRLGRTTSVFFCFSTQMMYDVPNLLFHSYFNNFLVLRTTDPIYNEIVGIWNKEYRRMERAGWGVLKTPQSIQTVAIAHSPVF